MVLVDFRMPGALHGWVAVNDGVMGGHSSGALVPCTGGAAFTGRVSFEDGGGFASVRASRRDWPTAGARGFALQVRGDGGRSRYTLRGEDGIQYQAGFTGGADWATIELPLADFVPRHRGRTLAGAPPLVPGAIRTLGFLIADRQSGPFQLEIASIATRP